MGLRSALVRVARRLGGIPKPVRIAAGLLLMALVGALDYTLPAETNFSAFYLIPICFMVWFVDKRWSVPLSFLAAAGGLWVDLTGKSSLTAPQIVFPNTAVWLGFFIIVSQALIRVRRAYELQEEVSRLKSVMMSMVSHEFSNGLTTLKLTTLLLRDSEGGVEPDTRKRYYEVLDRLTQRLTMTVANFLELSRLESGRLKLDLRPVTLLTLIEDTAVMLEPIFAAKGIRIAFDFPEKIEAALADPDALAIVISNLLGNAIKYTPAGGRVTVGMKREGGADRRIVVFVEDTGIGIRPQDRKKILAGNFRTEEGKAAAPGHGIGLKVSREILESHGSALQLESEPGKGSRFFFSLPVFPLWTVLPKDIRDTYRGGELR